MNPVHVLKISMLLVLLLFFAVGCAGAGLGKQTVVVKHYPQCYEPISTLREEARALSAKIAQGAVGGAITGALAGALSGKTENILIGAAAGAIVGASVAYIVTAEVQAKNREERFATYTQYLDQDYGTLDKAVSSARVTAKCYEQAYKQLEKDAKAGRISKEEAREKLKEIQDGSADAKEILAYYKDTSVANMKQFEEVQVAEKQRPADQLTPSQTKTYTQKVNNSRKKVSEAEIVNASLDDTINRCANMSKTLEAKLKRALDMLASL